MQQVIEVIRAQMDLENGRDGAQIYLALISAEY
jgi:hypothetical protein